MIQGEVKKKCKLEITGLERTTGLVNMLKDVEGHDAMHK